MLATSSASKLFFMLLGYLIINMRPDIVDKKNRPQIVPMEKLLAQYDYVIIGGGSAGAVLASRLSEDEDRTVLLLEAGVDEVPLSDLPWSYSFLQHTYLDWAFKTEPSSNYCLAMPNHQCSWPRGKVLYFRYLMDKAVHTYIIFI